MILISVDLEVLLHLFECYISIIGILDYSCQYLFRRVRNSLRDETKADKIWAIGGLTVQIEFHDAIEEQIKSGNVV